MKLVVNTMLGVEMQAVAEAIAFGEADGLDRERMLDGLEELGVLAAAHRPKLANARRDEYTVAFALRLMHKDFGLVLDRAADLGLELPATAASAAVCVNARDRRQGRRLLSRHSRDAASARRSSGRQPSGKSPEQGMTPRATIEAQAWTGPATKFATRI
jgi:3-hydroxyisobutyrate dehydrogenase-like beta-hydroxyacid dehydrogenase